MIVYLIITLLYSIKTSLIVTSKNITPITAGSTNTFYSFQFSNPTTPYLISSTTAFVISFPTNPTKLNIFTLSNCSISINSAPITSACSIDTANLIIYFNNLVTADTNQTNLSLSFNSEGAQYSSKYILSFYFIDANSNPYSDSSTSSSF